MKRAKPFLIERAGAEKPRKPAFISDAVAEDAQLWRARNRSLPEGLTLDFGGVNVGQPPPIDAMIMPSLNVALAGVSEEFPGACIQRGLLPHAMLNHLVRARFLSFFLLSARSAQEDTGVRASILLADAVHISGDWADKYVGDSNDIFETGRRFPNIHEAFLDRARWLKKNRRFGSVMRAMGDPVECLKQLGRCKLWDELGRKDRVATIAYDCLQECDALSGRLAAAKAAS